MTQDIQGRWETVTHLRRSEKLVGEPTGGVKVKSCFACVVLEVREKTQVQWLATAELFQLQGDARV